MHQTPTYKVLTAVTGPIPRGDEIREIQPPTKRDLSLGLGSIYRCGQMEIGAVLVADQACRIV